MLVVTVKTGEKLYAFLPDGQEIEIVLHSIRGGKIRLGLSSPRSVTFAREKIADATRRTHRYVNHLPEE